MQYFILCESEKLGRNISFFSHFHYILQRSYLGQDFGLLPLTAKENVWFTWDPYILCLHWIQFRYRKAFVHTGLIQSITLYPSWYGSFPVDFYKYTLRYKVGRFVLMEDFHINHFFFNNCDTKLTCITNSTSSEIQIYTTGLSLILPSEAFSHLFMQSMFSLKLTCTDL